MNMNAVPKPVPDCVPAYNPQHLHPMDEEDRKDDDTSEDIDWDEIIATTQDDWENGRYPRVQVDRLPDRGGALGCLEAG
jgi:hypothetical protein